MLHQCVSGLSDLSLFATKKRIFLSFHHFCYIKKLIHLVRWKNTNKIIIQIIIINHFKYSFSRKITYIHFNKKLIYKINSKSYLICLYIETSISIEFLVFFRKVFFSELHAVEKSTASLITILPRFASASCFARFILCLTMFELKYPVQPASMLVFFLVFLVLFFLRRSFVS